MPDKASVALLPMPVTEAPAAPGASMYAGCPEFGTFGCTRRNFGPEITIKQAWTDARPGRTGRQTPLPYRRYAAPGRVRLGHLCKRPFADTLFHLYQHPAARLSRARRCPFVVTFALRHRFQRTAAGKNTGVQGRRQSSRRSSNLQGERPSPRRLYETAVLATLRDKLRSDDVWVERSSDYRRFDSYCAPAPAAEWPQPYG